MASPAESSLLSRLKSNSDYKTLHQDFTNFLNPFSDFITLHPSNPPKPSISKHKKPRTTKDPKLVLRQITKQFLPFISQSLRIIPNRLSRPPKPELEEIVGDENARQLFDVYKLVLDCFDCISPCLEYKPFSVELERVRFVRYLEAWGFYSRAEVEVVLILEGVSIGEPEQNADPKFAHLVAEIVVCSVKCTYKSEKKEEEPYRKVLGLVDQALPWFRLLDEKVSQRLHRELANNLYKCTVYMLEGKPCCSGDLLPMFCMKTLKECLKLPDKDEFLKIVQHICLLLRSQWVDRPSLVVDILKCVFVPLACACKDLAPIDSILRLYTAGVYFRDTGCPSRNIDFPVSESSMAVSAICLFLDKGETLQHLPDVLDTLGRYFYISSNKDSYYSPICVEMEIKSLSCLSIGTNLKCSIACKTKHGKISLSSYLNALTFFCQPLAESVNKAYEHILAKNGSATLSCRVKYVQSVFHQFCSVFSSTQEMERENFYWSHGILHQVAISAFTISLKTGKSMQRSVDCIDHIISREWIQFENKKSLLRSIYNIGVYLYNAEQVEQATVALEQCCKASWDLVLLSCKKFVEKPVGIPNNISEETITAFVAQACERSVVLLNTLCHDVDKSINCIVNGLLNWSIARELFESLNFPTALVRKWVKIKSKDFKNIDFDDNAPILYSLLSKSMETLSKKTSCIVLEEELIAYEQVEEQNKEPCWRMQLKLINLLLLHVCDEKDYSLQKSRILIRKGRIYRVRGIEGLIECIQCLSDAISTLIDISNEDSSSTASIFHQLALTYCLRAMCNQEAHPDSEVIFHDIREAIQLWSRIDWSRDVHNELVTGNVVPLLCCVADLLSLKGYLNFQCDIFELIIIFLKRKEVSPEKCVAMFWADRRLSHSLCISAINEDFICKLSQHFGTNYNSISSWVRGTKDSRPLQFGLRQKFSMYDTIVPQVHWGKSPSGSNVTVDEVKEVTSDLLKVNVPSSVFLAGYLYYDLCQRFISDGLLFKALLYAREAFRLRCKLLKTKFICIFGRRPNKFNITGETTQKDGCNHAHVEVLGSVATEVWPHLNNSWKFEDSILSQWNILQSYLESILQVGAIHEAIGNSNAAEAFLMQGKSISYLEGLPIFGVAFASALGEIYCKMQRWDSAEKEFTSAKNILEDSVSKISCKRCKLALEVTVDKQFGDLIRRKYRDFTRASIYSDVLHSYKSAIEKLKPLQWPNSLSISAVTNELDIVGDKSTKPKEPKKLKMASKQLPREQCLKTKTTRMTRSKCRLSDNRGIQVQGEPPSEYSLYSDGNNGTACVDTHSQSGSHMELNQSSIPEFCCDETCLCNKSNCWRCHLIKVTETGTLTELINMRWEIYRRRVLLRLVMDIGECTGFFAEIHQIHEVFGEIISLMVNVRPFTGSSSAAPLSLLLKFIEKERQGSIFSIERAAILYNMSWFSVKNHSQENPRNTCCDLSRIQISTIIAWLMQAFVLCRELPSLFQKVSKLLAAIFLLPTSGGPSFSIFRGKTLSTLHWASFFHQASIGVFFNSQIFSNPSDQLKAYNSMDFEDAHIRGSPEKVDDLEDFVADFFEHLQSTTVVCISLLSGDYDSMLRGVLSLHSPSSSWMILSRLKLNRQPVGMLLPTDSIFEDNDANSGIEESIYEGSTSGRKWRCPWGYSVVDDLVPHFKTILDESFLSAASLPESQENRLLWWRTREKLDYRLKELLSDIEETWFGPWKCLLLGEPFDCNQLDSVFFKLVSDIKCRSKVDAKVNLLRIILGGTESVHDLQACLSQLFPYKSSLVKGGCSLEETLGGFSSTVCEVDDLSRLPHEQILEAAKELENKCINREPIILVLDSEVQMLPWENLPVLRKQEVYRMPSVGSISSTINISCHLKEQIGRVVATAFPSIDPLDAFYLLNPSGDLQHTQAEFEEWFKDKKLEGRAGRKAAPTTEELVSALKDYDLFIYFGHGNGTQYIPRDQIQKLDNCSATFLMGCSSGSLSYLGNYNPEGVVLSYLLAGSPVIVANLWDVTDKDIDKFGKSMLNAWLQERSTSSTNSTSSGSLVEEFESMNIRDSKKNAKKKVTRGRKQKEVITENRFEISCNHRPMIGSFMSEAREACKLPFLIGAAPVCYGVPTSIKKKKDL